MKKIIIGILSCQKNKEKRKAIEDTWLKNCPFKAYFLIGRPGLPAEISGNIIYLDCEDTYMGHTSKILAFYEFACKHLDFDYIYKCDDDTYVNPEVLATLPFHHYHYYGYLRTYVPGDNDTIPAWRKYHYNSVEPQYRVPYMGKVIGPWAFGGSGYFLSRHALSCINNYDRELLKDERLEDKMIGDIMIKSGITAGNTFLLKDQFYSKYGLFNNKWHDLGPIKFASLHPCSARAIRLIHLRKNFVIWSGVFLVKCLRKLTHLMSIFKGTFETCVKMNILKLNVKHLYGPPEVKYGLDELVVTCVVRNGGRYIKEFIEHYLALGVKHIVFLDNGSVDETIPIATSYDKVTVLQTDCPYKKYETLMKKYLVNRFSKDRWNLFVDIDELFDYPYSHQRDLKSLLTYLNRHSYTAVVAQMLDLFSEKPLSNSTEDYAWKDKHVYYDISNIEKHYYQYGKASNEDVRMHFGGIRKTVFNTNNGLTKAPLVLVNRKIKLFVWWHHTANSVLADFTAVLLHYPFSSSFYEKVMEAVKTDRYSNTTAGTEYKMYSQRLAQEPDLSLKLATARKLQNVEDLLDEGFLIASMQYLQWSHDTTTLEHIPQRRFRNRLADITSVPA